MFIVFLLAEKLVAGDGADAKHEVGAADYDLL